MSEYQSIDDAIYSIGSVDIVKKKNSPALGIIALLAGVAIIVANSSLGLAESNANLSAAMIFIGACITIYGIIKIASAIYGKGGIPIYRPTGAKMIRYKLYFDTAQKEKVCTCVRAGDFEKLATIPRSESSAVMVIMYRCQTDDVLLAQVLEFVPHFHQPMMDTLLFGKGDYRFSDSLAK